MKYLCACCPAMKRYALLSAITSQYFDQRTEPIFGLSNCYILYMVILFACRLSSSSTNRCWLMPNHQSHSSVKLQHRCKSINQWILLISAHSENRSLDQSINQSIIWPINQSMKLSIDQSIDTARQCSSWEPGSRGFNRPQAAHTYREPTDQSIIQSISLSVNRSYDRSISIN